APRLLAQVGEQRDIAAEQRLQRAADGAEDRPRAHRNAANEAECFRRAIAVDAECRRSHGDVHVLSPHHVLRSPPAEIFGHSRRAVSAADACPLLTTVARPRSSISTRAARTVAFSPSTSFASAL